MTFRDPPKEPQERRKLSSKALTLFALTMAAGAMGGMAQSAPPAKRTPEFPKPKGKFK
jgi:hypothetical protein